MIMIPNTETKSEAFIELKGLFYQTFLKRVHEIVNPTTYFEIGTLNGETLKLASCASISVDPHYQIASDVLGKKPAMHFYQVGSDEFFATQNPKSIFGREVDLAFLDGMHLFEFLLRDFTNIEKYCKRDSIVILHDCIPGDEYIATRSPWDPKRQKSVHAGYWTGDVWKILPALKHWRPDLRIVVVDAPPTGLVMITNLDRGNTVLDLNYQAILDGYLNLDLGAYGVARLHQECAVTSTEVLQTMDDLAPFFTPGTLSAKADKASRYYRYVSPLSLNGTADVMVTVETSSHDRSRPGPTFHDDPDGAGLFKDFGLATIPCAPNFIVEAEGLQQIGYRSYLTKGGSFFTDEALVPIEEEARFLNRFGQQDPFLNEETGLVPTGAQGEFTLDIAGRTIRQLDGKVVSLCSFEPSNYGAFLFRVLPKLAGRPHLLDAPTFLAPMYHDVMRDLYMMADLPVERIIPLDTTSVYRFEKLVVPSARNSHTLFDTESREFYARLRDRFGSRSGARKIFVSRLGWTESYAAKHRVMINEEVLAERLAAAGYEIVRPHTMTARQQIEVFASAEIIVGAASSAMFNVVFSQPGTKVVDIESEPHWIFSHTNLFGSCGLDYGIFEARAHDQDWSVPHKPFSVNIDALMTRLSSL
jgi:hypothetical protein